MEIWDLYTEKRELTGKEHIRGEEIPRGFYHLVVHVWIRDRKGEDSLSVTLRETEEEVGIKMSPEKGKILYSMTRRVIHGDRFSDIVDVWLFEYDGPVNLELARTKEVTQALWMNKSKIKELFDEGKLINTLGYFFELEKV